MDASSPDAGAPLRDAGSPVAGCCPSVVTIEGCRIVPVGESVTLSATADGTRGSHFRWSTSSPRIVINGDTSRSAVIQARGTPSPSRDAETVTVEVSSDGCASVTGSITLTVVRVRFSESPTQTQGYDDMDTAGSSHDDHVSVKKLSSTSVHVTIEGGVVGTDLRFRTADASIATIGAVPASASFDLPITGGDANKDETLLEVHTQCRDARHCASIHLHTYRENVMRATVGRFFDSRRPATTLTLPLVLADAEAQLNDKYKAAVARVALTDLSTTGAPKDVAYDRDGDGKLSYDIINSGGAELDAIMSHFHADGLKIVIVRDMASYYYLSSDALAGTTSVDIRAGLLSDIYLTPGSSYPIGSGSTAETISVTAVSTGLFSHTITLASPLRHLHVQGETIEFPAAAWSGDPIVLSEGRASLQELYWTMGHEMGHSVHHFSDVTSTTNIMLYVQGATDHRLRYKEQTRHYTSTLRGLVDMGPGSENQWDLISR